MMESGMFSHNIEIRTIDLFSIEFNWQAGDDQRPKLNTHAATLVFDASDNVDLDTKKSAFVEFILKRENDNRGSFEISATYYLLIKLPQPDMERHDGLMKDIVSKLVWGRFYDLSKILLMNADIRDVEIPFTPSTVGIRQNS